MDLALANLPLHQYLQLYLSGLNAGGINIYWTPRDADKQPRRS